MFIGSGASAYSTGIGFPLELSLFLFQSRLERCQPWVVVVVTMPVSGIASSAVSTTSPPSRLLLGRSYPWRSCSPHAWLEGFGEPGCVLCERSFGAFIHPPLRSGVPTVVILVMVSTLD